MATSLAPPLYAQSDADRATARSLGQEGETALDGGDFKTAEDSFRRADRLVHAPTLMLGLARSLAGLHRFVEAQETYNRIIREGVAPGASQVFKDAVEQAKREVDGVAPHIGGVTIVVQAAGGGDVPNKKVVLDGAPVNTASLGVRRAIDPGAHVLQVTADGFKPAELHFQVTEGGSVDTPVTLEKDPNAVVAPTPTPTPTPVPLPPGDQHFTPVNPGAEQPVTVSSSFPGALPWATLGVGGAALVFGAITGVVAMGKHSDLAKVCPGGTCGSDQQSAVDSYHSMATLSTVGFIVGGIGVAGGVIMLLLKPSASSPPPPAAASSLSVTPVFGLGSVGAVGTF
ncbi:MAG TPA: hypothetical protein VGL81_33195 [Polyangiaceae bacterium]